jgi:hypothetical protein
MGVFKHALLCPREPEIVPSMIQMEMRGMPAESMGSTRAPGLARKGLWGAPRKQHGSKTSFVILLL